jgi:hypothetical protein
MIIISMFLYGILPNYGVEEQWTMLYKTANENAIKKIQNQFECCGFNTTLDRAWPFVYGTQDGSADQCERMYKRTRSCVDPWRRAEQIHARLFTAVIMVNFLIKVYEHCRI